MTDFFLRAYRLQVGTVEIDARSGVGLNSLRIAFSIQRDEKRTPNAIEIRIWNLSEGNRKALASAENVSVSLEAGYANNVGQLFLGDLRSARTVREGPDLVTCVSGGDGEKAIRSARINRTFKAGTPVKEVLRALSQQLTIGAGNLGTIGNVTYADGSTTLKRAQTMSGLIYDELEDLCRSCGLRWSVQDSALQLRRGDAPVGERQGPLLRADSGLIGQPQVELDRKKGTLVTFEALLLPDVIPGVPVRCESDAFSGNLVVLATEHVGDSHGSEWYVRGTGRPYGA
jgi:hypothetical protein